MASDFGAASGVEFWRAEALRWRVEAEQLVGYRAEAERLAADNVGLQARVVDLEGQVGALTEKVSMLAGQVFGDLVGEEAEANARRGLAGGRRVG